MEVLIAAGVGIPVLFVVLLWTANDKRSIQTLQTWSTCLSLVLFCDVVACSSIAWALKDGLGPDSAESHGIVALQKFFALSWPIFLFAITMWLVGVYGFVSSVRRIQNKK